MSDSAGTLARRLADAFAVSPKLVEELRTLHSRQWRLEDVSRQRSASPVEVAHVKREIDASNSRRHEIIDAIDAHVVTGGSTGSVRRYYSETVGELCDRLLIADLKQQALSQLSHSKIASDRPVQVQQLDALVAHLSTVVDQLIRDARAGHAALPPRVGLKVYNRTATPTARAASEHAAGRPT